MTQQNQLARSRALQKLPGQLGVYALCDVDAEPIYVGKSAGGKAEGIRARVRRHLTSARSDIIANRMLDIWEVAHVWAWPCKDPQHASLVEAWLFSKFDDKSKLMNGKLLARPAVKPAIPDVVRVQVLTDEEISRRRDQRYRFPRQLQHLGYLLDYLLEVKDEHHVRRSLSVHFERTAKYHFAFQDSPPSFADDDSDDAA